MLRHTVWKTIQPIENPKNDLVGSKEIQYQVSVRLYLRKMMIWARLTAGRRLTLKPLARWYRYALHAATTR